MTRFVSMLVFCSLLAVSAPPPTPALGAAGGIDWYPHDEGLRLARETGKKVYIFFSTEDCVWCRRMAASTFRDEAVVEQLNRHFVPVRVDREKESAVARQYYPGQEVPYSWFLTADGGEIARRLGYIPPETMVWMLKYIASDSYKEITFEHFVRRSK